MHLVELRNINRGETKVQTLKQDARYAIRQLLKSPGFAIVAIFTLALGIGTNTAMFSVVNGWLRPLPVRDPNQLMVLAAQQKGDTLGIYYFSYPDLVDFRNQADTFSDLFAYQIGLGGLSVGGRAEPLVFSYVTGNYFSALGVRPAAGRLFLPGEGEQQGAAPMVVLGYSYWQQRFGADPGVIGSTVRIDGNSAVVVGVAPRGFHGVSSNVDMQAYLPLSMLAGESRATGLWTDRDHRVLAVLGRLKSGISPLQAQSSVNVIASRLAQEYPKTDEGVTVSVVPEKLARPIPKIASAIPLIAGLFLVLAGVVLVLACMNVANLTLVRATSRQREISVRMALGASRGRIVRQMLTESLILASLSAFTGVFLGMWASGIISSINLGTKLPLVLDFSFDWNVFAYGVLAALTTGVIVGVWPALRAARNGLNAGLQEGGRGGSAGAGRLRVRSILVVAQVACSLMLLVVAARFVRSLDKAQNMALGFDPDNVLNVMLDPHQVGYDRVRSVEFFRELERRVGALPGVQSTSQAFSIPMGNYNDGSQVFVEGQPLLPGQQPPLLFFNRIGPDYFKTTRIQLMQGRTFTEADNATAQPVVIINQAMADRFWPGQDAIGRRFSSKSATGPFMQVVGVARDSKLFGYFSGPLPYYYVPFDQNFSSMRILQIRSSVSPESLIPLVKQKIHDLDAEMPVSDLQTMREAMAGGNGFLVFRLGAGLTAAMGILGFVIAIVGVYSVVSFAAAQRTREIGVRVALGASERSILTLILGQGVRLIGIGVVIGLAAAFGLTRAMAGLLVGVSAVDPITFVPVTLALFVVAVGACYIPARRAMRLDPVVALRHE
jgi:predicted permease